MTLPLSVRLRAVVLLTAALPAAAMAFSVGIRPDSRMIYLRVGDGEFGLRPYSTYSNNDRSQPRSGGAVNEVSGIVAASAVGNGQPQSLTGAARLTSDWDDFAFCNAGQIYVGGFFRDTGTSGTATLSARVSAPLSNGTATIPFSQIGWTASGNSDAATAVQPIPAGRFDDVARVIASFPVNVWQESCHSFFYRNERVVATGTYTGTITYTISAP